MKVTTRHKLLTNAWTTDVEELETAIGLLNSQRRATNECEVMFFEMARDPHLHVNVTHRHQTREIGGWAGPGDLPQGFVHNRTFSAMPPALMLRNIRSMVFAERI